MRYLIRLILVLGIAALFAPPSSGDLDAWNNGQNANITVSNIIGKGSLKLSGDNTAITVSSGVLQVGGSPIGGGTTNMMVSTITWGATLSPTFAIANLSTTAAAPRRVTFRATADANVTTINAPAGTLIDGDTMVWEILQDGTGGWTIAGWDAKYAFGTDITGITLSTGANQRDFITFTYNSTADKWFVVGYVRGY